MQGGSNVQGVPLPSTPFKLINGLSGKPVSASDFENVSRGRPLPSKGMPCKTLAGFFQLQPVGLWSPAYRILNLQTSQALSQGNSRESTYSKVIMQPINENARETRDVWEIIPSNFFPYGSYLVQNANTGWQLAWDSSPNSRLMIVDPRFHLEKEFNEDHKRRIWMFSVIEEGFPTLGIPPTQTLFKLKNVGTGEFIRADSRSSCIVPYKRKMERMDLQFRLVAPRERLVLYPSSYLIESVSSSKFLCVRTWTKGDKRDEVLVKFETLNEGDIRQHWTIVASERSSEEGSYVVTNCGTDAGLRYEVDRGIADTVPGMEFTQDSSKQMTEASAVETITTSTMEFNGCTHHSWIASP
ncbi:hypothetical protein R1sor_003722 [Riccia sorocarpa]|uniref:Uncharacterized protein n=1 Tax=Riccia sorocarpa TaxID=122646 RepID=A0ABD3H5W6_9MARC